MAMMDSAAWSGQDHNMHPGPDDDFQQFLDMNGMGNLAEGLQFDFQDFQNANAGHMMNGPRHREPLDTPMSGTDQPIVLSRTDSATHPQMTAITTAASHPGIPTAMAPPPPTPSDAISEIDAQIQYLQQQRLQQQQRQLEEQQAAYFAQQSRIVPPTPQSLELPPGNSQFYTQSDQQQQAMYDGFQRLKDQQEMAFTPLVSPAVTPLETQFPIDAQFTVPGAYFSPLTSPALHAQNDPVSVYEQRHWAANTSSPGEMDLEPGPGPGPPSGSKDLAKKARKNNAAKTRAKPNVRQSPISKPQRRKTGSTPILNAQVLSDLAENTETNQEQDKSEQRPRQQQPTPAVGAADSENDSVSPETLSDMPPPPLPKPRSARPSPYIHPQNSQSVTPKLQPTPGKPSPATPASLMKLASPNIRDTGATTEGQGSIAVEHIENFELPESANFPKPHATPINTKTTVQLSPEIHSAKSSSFQPPPSPSFVKPAASASASANQSPQLTAGASSSSAARKTPQLAPRGSAKKRSSISNSVHVSPVLRPKISPNIKPLLPGGGAGMGGINTTAAEDAASQLLASKSNYQNILEGNKVPGVSYPSELSTNLTSKRTSHKIAEQGRRNRINSALQEIATMLPRPVPRDPKEGGNARSSDGEGGSESKNDGEEGKSAGGGGGMPSSKASTVEMAIEYIKQLRREVAEATRRAEEAERKLEMKEGPS